MFSSKVIKQDDLSEQQVSSVNFETLLDKTPSEELLPASSHPNDGFIPLFNDAPDSDSGQRYSSFSPMDGKSDRQKLDAPTNSEFPVPNLIQISEEEIERQLSDAYAKGVEEGRLAAERGLANVFRALRDGVDSIVSLRSKVLRDCEGDLLKLSTVIAKRIIMQELTQDSQILVNIINATVSSCSENEKLTIKLNPKDYKMLVAENKLQLAGLGDENRISLSPDEGVRLGGCMVETPTGVVDARIETQLEEVYSRCLEERGIPREPSISLQDSE